MEPTVTIITPIANIIEKGQLDDFNLLISLLDLQTYPNIEHLIIDNGSKDGTLEMLKDYKNKGFINFFSEHDTGKFNAYNKGVMHAKGKYVTFLSCDDFIHDITAIADVVNLMEANNADFTFSPAYCRHPEGFVFLFAPSMYNVFQVMPCARQGMFFKKSTLEQEGYFDEKFKYLADFDMIIRLVLKKKVGILYDSNYVTYKFADKIGAAEDKAIAESKSVFYKNYKNLYPLNDQLLERMALLSEFPQGLLDKLVNAFPPNDKELFFEKCQLMNDLRVEAVAKQNGGNQ